MKRTLLLASVLASALASGSAFATASASATFAGACSGASFDASGSDIEYFDLNLDLVKGGSKECVITTTIPGTPGLAIHISSFKAEAFADITNGGIATLLVNHRITGQNEIASRAIAHETGDLVAEQQTVGRTKCGQAIELRTKLTVKAVKAILLQDSATSNTVTYKIDYTPCH